MVHIPRPVRQLEQHLVTRVIVLVLVVWTLLGVVTVGALNCARLLLRSSARNAERAWMDRAPALVGGGHGDLPVGSLPAIPVDGAPRGGVGTWPPPLADTARRAA